MIYVLIFRRISRTDGNYVISRNRHARCDVHGKSLKSSSLKVRYNGGGKSEWKKADRRFIGTVSIEESVHRLRGDKTAGKTSGRGKNNRRGGERGLDEGIGKIGNNCRSCMFEERTCARAICASGKCMLRWQQLRDVIDTTFLPI